MLDSEGYNIVECGDGGEAVGLFEQVMPDLVLLDFMLPGLNGIEVCTQLKALPRGATVPVIMVTALDDPTAIEQAFEAGAFDYITKPVHWVALRHRVRRLIQYKRNQDQVLFQASLLEQVHNAVIVADGHDQVLYWNHAAKRLHQWDVTGDLSRTIGQYLLFPDGKPIHIADVEAKQVDGFWDTELVARQRNGTLLPVQTVFTSITDPNSLHHFTVGISIDITERKAQQQALHNSRELYRTLINHFPNGAVFLYDHTLTVSLVGGVDNTLFMHPNEQMTGHVLYDILPRSVMSTVMLPCQQALNGESSTVTVEYQDKIYQFYIHPVRDADNKVEAGLVMAQNITELKKAEQILREHQNSLEIIVEQRTSELTRTNEALQWEIAGRQRVEAELQYRVEFDQLMASISTRLISLGTMNIEQGIPFALQAIGEFATVERSFVFTLSEDEMLLHSIFEWVSPKIVDLEIGTTIQQYRTIPTALFPWMMERLSLGQAVSLDAIDDLPASASSERKLFIARGCQSCIIMPMTYNGKLTGFIGLDTVTERRSWEADVPPLLKMVGELFASVLEHRRTEAALRYSEQQLRQITDTMLDAVYQIDVDGVVQYASPSCWTVLGVRPDHLLHDNIFRYVHPDDVQQMRMAIKTVGTAEYRFRHSDGNYVWLETLGNILLADSDSGEGYVLASRNITERKRAEHELQELNRLKTEFLSTAAHELRTPLTSIRGFSEILITRQLDENRQKHFLKLINEQSSQLGKLIDDLLDISRLEAKRAMTLHVESLDLCLLINNLVQTFKEAAERHAFSVVAAEPCVAILGDRLRLSQVIQNLLSNAVKYSPKGGTVTIEILERADRQLQVNISDQGIGMTPDQQVHLFEKFYRADASNTAISGTGLGLAISKLIVELHGGKIWAESVHGQGTTFAFTLPTAPADEAPADLASLITTQPAT